MTCESCQLLGPPYRYCPDCLPPCERVGHTYRAGDANGQEPDHYVNCAVCSVVWELTRVTPRPLTRTPETCGYHDWTGYHGKAACVKCGANYDDVVPR